ncbi:NAD-dependent DNA ligase LigA, partial [Brevibacillus sp. MCWH]|nr:NAD-dependent DNA ligase LigA [Brevibacillus sp. MCWH]
IVTPTTCPYCGQKLIKEPVLKCVNIECESRMIGKIMNYVTKMSIPNISIGIITNLYKEGVLKSIEDLYRLEKHKKRILLLEGFGEKLFNKIIDGINSRKEVFDYQLLGAIGIPEIGEKMFKKILTVYNIEELIKISENGEKGKLTT